MNQSTYSQFLSFDRDFGSYDVESVIEVLTPHVTPERRARMDTVLAHRLQSVALGLEDLNKSHNAVACLRTAESFGIQDIVAVEAINAYPLPEEPEDPEVGSEPYVARKITAYAHRWVDLHRLERAEELTTWAGQREMRIFGTSPHATDTIEDVPLDRPILVLFGNEKEGLRPETAERCDGVFRLPMYGFTESFNLSVTVDNVISYTIQN